MNKKAKYFLIPFVLMIIFNLGSYYIFKTPNFGEELNPHLGILFTSGLFFGPYGMIGAVIANLLCDLIRGYSFNSAFPLEIVSFLVAYLGYKIWFTLKNQSRNIRLNSTQNLLYFFLTLFLCGTMYSLLLTKMVSLLYPNTLGLHYITGIRYFINFINFSLIFSIILIWLSREKDFTYTPQCSNREYNPKIYRILLIALVFGAIIISFADFIHKPPYYVNLIETLLLISLMALYVTKPIKSVNNITFISIPEKIMDAFLVILLVMVVIYIINMSIPHEYVFKMIRDISPHDSYLLLLTSLDLQILIIFIPSYFIIRYIEKMVVRPILSFSKIESRIKEDKKIEVKDLIDVYSKYSNQKDEIGMLSRSYINLVNYNNNYIENLKKVENEKQRIKTELDIAYKIQKSILPTKSIENDDYFITGLSRPAKEVGGDFFDYFEIDDENLVIVIGDSSDKGVPAAMFSTIVQNSIQQNMIHEKNPAKVLTEVNNQICRKNTEVMFITLWLGIYNRNSHKLVYSNGGHNPPMIRKEGKFEKLETDSNLVLGLQEDFTYTKQETILQDALFLYTDGVTDAQNEKNELYGEKNLLKILNDKMFNEKHIELLLDDLDKYMDKEEQYDDITVTYLKILK